MKKSKEILEKVLELLELGNTLTSICRPQDMPNLATIYKWMHKDEKLKEKILTARKLGAVTWLDKMQDLLEQPIEPQQVQLVREKLQHARWLASKLVSIFGDKQTIENVGDPVIKVIWSDDGSPEHKGKDSTHTIRGSNKENDNNHDTNTIN